MLLTEREKVAHLLRRFGLGASEAEIEYYGRDGHKGAIDRLINYSTVNEGFDFGPVEWITSSSPKKGGLVQKVADNGIQALKTPQLQVWWFSRLLCTQRPLQEKLTLFWHDHFATSADKVTTPALMYQQNEILRKNAGGRFRDLLMQVSKDPAMLFWLDNQFNVKERPNENFAREVMELFTLGIGNYTETDIQEAARAFSGWGLAAPGKRAKVTNPKNGKINAKSVFDEGLKDHDDGLKTVLGSKGKFNGDDVLGILCSQQRTAWYITSKMWEWFAYQDPEKELIDRLAERYFTGGMKTLSLVRDIMESSEFYSEKAIRRMYKNPVDFTIATMRSLGLGSMPPAQVMVAAAIAKNSCKSMGMDLMFPPDVSGWAGGAAWISSATMVERMKWATLIFGQSDTSVAKVGNLKVKIDPYSLFANNPTPQGVVDSMLSIFDAPMPQAKVVTLVESVRKSTGERIDRAKAAPTASAVAKLIFGSPEFQFC